MFKGRGNPSHLLRTINPLEVRDYLRKPLHTRRCRSYIYTHAMYLRIYFLLFGVGRLNYWTELPDLLLDSDLEG